MRVIRNGDGDVSPTAKSSRLRYFPLETFVVMVPKSMGCWITSLYPGTSFGFTGWRKKA